MVRTGSTLIAALALAACGFRTHASNGDGAGQIDAAVIDGAHHIDALVIDAVPSDAPWYDAGDSLGDVAHVSSTDEGLFDGTADWDLTTQLNFDTSSAAMSVPDGVELHVVTQDTPEANAPQLLLLEVNSLTIESGAGLYLFGSLPLVIIARTTIVIHTGGVIDARSSLASAGPDGGAPGIGPGAGGSGAHTATVGSYQDSGGGGGGFGGVGGAGGSAGPAEDLIAGGTVGASYGDLYLTTLQGGSGGGRMSPACTGFYGGAGGGAVQLYARLSMQIDGLITASGGGGSGGMDGTACPMSSSSGAGGGAGGAIYLQTLALTGSGFLAANGGGGGGGASPSENGDNGGDSGGAGISALSVAVGGAGAETAANGGSGGFGTTAAVVGGGVVDTTNNAGGGGGGVGRIVVRARTAALTLQSSPPVVRP